MSVVAKDVPHVIELSDDELDGRDSIRLPSGRCVTYHEALTLRYIGIHHPHKVRLIRKYMNRDKWYIRFLHWLTVVVGSAVIVSLTAYIIISVS